MITIIQPLNNSFISLSVTNHLHVNESSQHVTECFRIEVGGLIGGGARSQGVIIKLGAIRLRRRGSLEKWWFLGLLLVIGQGLILPFLLLSFLGPHRNYQLR